MVIVDAGFALMRFLRDVRFSIADSGALILLAALVLTSVKLIAIYF
jgi:hypothetical protein